MRKYSSLKWLPLIGLALLPLLLTLAPAITAEPEAPAGGFVPAWDQNTLVQISTNDNSAVSPSIRRAPNGTLLIAYDKFITSIADRDPYFSRSTNNGQSWSAPAAIVTTTPNSAQVDVEFDSASTAHAVWVENEKNIVYTKSGAGAGSWPNGIDTVFSSSAPNFIFSAFPDLVISQNDTMDVVWRELNLATGFFVKLSHARKKVGDSAWLVTGNVPVTTQDVIDHALAVQGNTLHLVWSESALPKPPQIRYSQGAVSGGSVSWSAAITLTNTLSDVEAKLPVINIVNNQIRVAFTTLIAGDQQQVYYRRCSSGCTNIGNWTSPVKVSGADLEVAGSGTPTSPTYIYSDMASDSGCTYIYFHGKQPGSSGNEDIWGNRNCGAGWSRRQQVPLSLPEAKTIKPSLAVDGVWMHLVFERTENVQQVYYIRGNPNVVYLPLILKK